MVTGEVTAEAVTRLSKAEKTEVWAQARVSVSSCCNKVLQTG